MCHLTGVCLNRTIRCGTIHKTMSSFLMAHGYCKSFPYLDGCVRQLMMNSCNCSLVIEWTYVLSICMWVKQATEKMSKNILCCRNRSVFSKSSTHCPQYATLNHTVVWLSFVNRGISRTSLVFCYCSDSSGIFFCFKSVSSYLLYHTFSSSYFFFSLWCFISQSYLVYLSLLT